MVGHVWLSFLHLIVFQKTLLFVFQEYSVEYWIAGGVSPSKLVVGMPAYARGFTLSSTGDHSVGASASGPSDPGDVTGEEGVLAYYEVC